MCVYVNKYGNVCVCAQSNKPRSYYLTKFALVFIMWVFAVVI